MKFAPRLLSVLAVCCSILGIGCDPGSDHAPAAPPAAAPTTPVGPPGATPTDWAPVTDDTWTRTGPTPVETHGQLSVMGTSLVDQNGTTVQLKGVSSMWLNWEADGFAENAAALVWMRDHWNVELIRAAMGVEPAGAYLADPSKATQQVERIVANAVAAGVYVLIDWHDHNAHLNKERAVAFFSQMAEKYKDVPNVLYEPFNEPEQLDWPTIKAYHETVLAAIRAVDPDNVIILGTPNWSQYVDVAAASPVAGANLMYTLHFYTCTHTGWLRTRAEAALAAGLALFVTEWGASAADGGLDGKVCYAEATTWMNWLETKQIGWSAWKLDGCNPDSTCLLQPGAPASGGWDAEYLHGHAEFVRDALRK
jgi:endoglucanase